MTHVLVPGPIAAGMRDCGAKSGSIDVRNDTVENLVVVVGFSKGTSSKRLVATTWLGDHYTAHVPVTTGVGVWYRSDFELHELGRAASRRSAALPTEAFREHVEGGWTFPPMDRPMFVVTLAETPEGDHEFAGWSVSREIAAFFPVEVVDEDADLFDPLGESWPRSALAGKRVTIVGAGSIGSAAAEALAAYAVRHLALVDPDRLHGHNFARHRVTRTQIGRMKVSALSDMLTGRDDGLQVERFPLDVILDADVMRPLFARSACILAASDGIASRRAANHLACRARVPIVLACVLEDGRLGEVIRVRPGVTACLLCSREQLAEAGVLNPEPSLDLGYGEGHRHLPMTAVGGDLDIVGRLAARAVVSTLLEDAGFLGERLPGDHGVIGLRPALDWEPEEPFDVERSLAVKWHLLGTPSPDCPSCVDRL
jgi:molybdopterin-synthase adenylyltransferase